MHIEMTSKCAGGVPSDRSVWLAFIISVWYLEMWYKLLLWLEFLIPWTQQNKRLSGQEFLNVCPILLVISIESALILTKMDNDES